MMTYQRLFLLVLILGTFAWRVTGLTYQSLWRDEVDAIYFALRDLPDTLAMFVDMAQNGALYFLSLRGWFYLAGASEFALRYVSVMASMVSIPLTWQVARRLLGNTSRASTVGQSIIPLLAVLFLAFNPYQLWYAQEGKMYTLVIALTLFAHWCWLTGITQGGKRIWLAYLITVSICLYIHLLSIIIIPLHFCWFMIAWPQSRWHWRGYGFALAGLTLPYLPFVWWQWAMLTSTEKLTGFNFTPLSEMLYTLLINHSYGLLPVPPLFRLLPIFFLGAVGLLFGAGALAAVRLPSQPKASPEPDMAELAVRSSAPPELAPWRRYLLIVSWLLVPIATIYVLSLRQPVYTDRYIIWIAPAAMILLALGVQTLYQQGGRLALPLVAILLIYTLGLWGQMGWQQKNQTIKYDLRSAIHYVAERRQPETLLVLQIPHIEFSYRYYSDNEGNAAANVYATSDARIGNWRGGLWTNNGLADEQAIVLVEQEMAQITQGVQELWVLSSEVEMWDARHLMNAWLDSHGRLVEMAEFHGVHARRYVLEARSQP